MSARPLISVLVPTRERLGTLRACLASALDQDFDDFEVVVSDNASGDGTEEYVKSMRDPRVKYVTTARRLSMCDNFENALNASSGRYVVIIGDDDAIVPGTLSYLATAIARTKARVLTWPYAKYIWPNGSAPARSHPIPHAAEGEVDLAKIAKLSARLGGAGYSRLVSPYHSCVERSVLDEVKARVGRVFASTMPDIFLHYAIPAIVTHAHRLPRVITVGGVSARSNSGSFRFQNSHPEFESESDRYRPHHSLFPGWSPSTVLLVDCMLVAADAFPEFYGTQLGNRESILGYLCSSPIGGHTNLGFFGVLSKRSEIRKYRSLKLPHFAAWWAFHKMLRVRLELIRQKDKVNEQVDPALNVHDFARRLA